MFDPPGIPAPAPIPGPQGIPPAQHPWSNPLAAQSALDPQLQAQIASLGAAAPDPSRFPQTGSGRLAFQAAVQTAAMQQQQLQYRPIPVAARQPATDDSPRKAALVPDAEERPITGPTVDMIFDRFVRIQAAGFARDLGWDEAAALVDQDLDGDMLAAAESEGRRRLFRLRRGREGRS